MKLRKIEEVKKEEEEGNNKDEMNQWGKRFLGVAWGETMTIHWPWKRKREKREVGVTFLFYFINNNIVCIYIYIFFYHQFSMIRMSIMPSSGSGIKWLSVYIKKYKKSCWLKNIIRGLRDKVKKINTNN
jgi:hypothetical protein